MFMYTYKAALVHAGPPWNCTAAQAPLALLPMSGAA
eukprot:CAMPEP_0202894090 /NCGR_PEP_ID=MMETSP1392-20130828/3536_1 /ASSEMBLY_ACC=CAM_ASM_000868 /TAXON_ID=225041 /ORGANISM="Chlamydomonas chlamydogama, Strain SAG 11-48b" /LENGTH=35 /DNA_ID= /DNA_START= /DNA_END= /DNA_ORIENTATION=